MKRPIYLISKTPYPGVIHIPVLSTELLEPKIDFLRYDGLIVTSKQALDALEFSAEGWKRLPTVCVGESTAARARELGVEVLAVGNGYGDSLADILTRKYPMWRWLFARPEVVASSFAETAEASGVRIDHKVVYRTGCNPHLESVSISEDAVLVFTSPSAIRCFTERFRLKSSYVCVVIGRTTAAALPESIEAHVAEHPSVESAIELARSL